MPTISVIVPVYNAEDTLERCVGSILAQTHADLDVILVDDGSTDISGAMCDAYAEFDPRVRAFHTPNRGLSAARNLGIDQALESGTELIAFADADDWLEPDMLQTLLYAMESSKADVAQCGVRIDGLRSTSCEIPFAELLDKENAMAAIASGAIYSVVWNKLYRSHIFKGTRFPEGRNFEDIATTYRLIKRCKAVISIPHVGYHNVKRECSITHTHTMDNLEDFWIAHVERFYHLEAKEPFTLDDELRSLLARGPASAISRMWRWAYSNSKAERLKYANVFLDMQRFEHDILRKVDKSRWSLALKAPLALARINSSISLVIGYCANQVAIRVLPSKSSTRC